MNLFGEQAVLLSAGMLFGVEVGVLARQVLKVKWIPACRGNDVAFSVLLGYSEQPRHINKPPQTLTASPIRSSSRKLGPSPVSC